VISTSESGGTRQFADGASVPGLDELSEAVAVVLIASEVDSGPVAGQGFELLAGPEPMDRQRPVPVAPSVPTPPLPGLCAVADELPPPRLISFSAERLMKPPLALAVKFPGAVGVAAPALDDMRAIAITAMVPTVAIRIRRLIG
jgi:hypothetical protein